MSVPILGLTPLFPCTTKSSAKGPVVQITSLSDTSSPLPIMVEISDPGSELAAEAGLEVNHASIVIIKGRRETMTPATSVRQNTCKKKAK